MSVALIRAASGAVIRTGGGPRGAQGDQGNQGLDASDITRTVYFTAEEGQSEFDLGTTYQSAGIYFFLNGIPLDADEFYAPSGEETTITLLVPASAGDKVQIGYLLPTNRVARQVNVFEFGAVGDGVTDDYPAFQRALDYLKSVNGGTLRLPVVPVCYVVSAGLEYISESPICIEGERLGSARPYSYEGQTAINYTGAAGTTALTIETSGASEAYPGVAATVRNLLLFRDDIEELADDGVGIAFRGIHRIEVDSVGVWGIATGILTDDNPTAAGATSVRCNATVLRRLDIRKAARHRIRICGSAETQLEYCTGEADPVVNYTADLYVGPGTNSGRCDALKAVSCTFIGGTEVVADMPDYNVQLDRMLWAVFYGCAFERARYAGLQISNASGDAYTHSVGANQWFGVKTYGCEFNGQGGACIDVFRSRFAFRDTECHQMDGSTEPAIRVRAGVGAEIPALGGLISGGMIHFSGPNGIDIDNAASVTVDGGTYFVDTTTSGNESVKLGVYTTNCTVAHITGDGSAGSVLDDGEFNTIDNAAQGYVYNQGVSEEPLYVSGTLDGSGNALIAHSIANFTLYAMKVSADYLSAGAGSARYPLTVNYWDNANVSVSGGAPAASKSCRVHFTLKRNGVL
jgi:hypothetical protein